MNHMQGMRWWTKWTSWRESFPFNSLGWCEDLKDAMRIYCWRSFVRHCWVSVTCLSVTFLSPFVTPLYISQKYRYWHKIFKIWSFGSTKYIHDIKGDPVLQVSCQEPLTSSKYPHKGSPIIDTLLINISTRNFPDMSLGVYQVHP